MDIKHSGPKLSAEEAWLTMLCMLIYVLDLFDRGEGGGAEFVFTPVLYAVCKRSRRRRNTMCIFKGVLRS